MMGTLFHVWQFQWEMLKDKIKDIVFSEKFEKFKKIIREKGTINGCNRCGWLKPVAR